MNLQQIEKQHLRTDGNVEIFKIFKTIQGEGPFAGSPAIFIRMAGCNLQCPGCDTDYTSFRNVWDPDQVSEILKDIHGEHDNLVVITGGEPFRQNIAPMVNRILDDGYSAQLETNGTLYIPDLNYDHENLSIVCSPKTPKLNEQLEKEITFYKYILHADFVDPEDGLPTRALLHTAAPRVARPRSDVFDWEDYGRMIYVQPYDDFEENHFVANSRHTQAALKSCMKYGYTLSLQMHKLLGLE